jgi:hypothetical protein
VAPFFKSKRARTKSRELENRPKIAADGSTGRSERETGIGRTMIHKSRFRGQPRSWLYNKNVRKSKHGIQSIFTGRMSRGSCGPADGFDAITGLLKSVDLRTISSAGRASSNSNARTNVNNRALILHDSYRKHKSATGN